MEKRANTKRNYIPGTEWVYYQIFCGPASSDKIITDLFFNYLEELFNEKKIKKWFFIRYFDPSHHIRLRLHLSKISYSSEILEKISKILNGYFTSGLIHNIKLDTYQRELERYGHKTICLGEKLFHIDSVYIVRSLDQISSMNTNERWLFALKTNSDILMQFNYDLNMKVEFLNTLQESYGREFGMNKNLRVQLDQKYREYFSKIESVLNINEENTYEFEYKNSLKVIAEELIFLKNQNSLERPLQELLTSYMHMTNNRIFVSKGRINEMVIYYFLHKYFKSLRAKYKYSNTQ